MAVPLYLHICQYVAYIIAIASNCLLLHLIRMRAGSSFGKYRILMISFSIYSLVYANVEILALPVMYVEGAGMIFYVDSVLKHHADAGLAIAIIYCGCLALCISMLTTHFIFRYVAVCRPEKMALFKGNRIYFLFIPPFTLFSIWAASIYGNYRPNEVKREFFRRVLKDLYEEDIDQVAFIAPLYYTHQPDGSLLFRHTDLFGCALSCTIMSACFSTCIFCAIKTYFKLHDSSLQMSNKTRSLSKQLFWSLGLQTLLPCFTQYIPVGLVFILPLFEVEIGKYINFVGVTCSLYPALDPPIAIFIIDRFRNYLLKKETSAAKISQISTYKSQGESSLIA
uniref:Serpentine receptor class r-10 n=1 Tax=Caenorhabditis tropicalis TaxID=1561998 RepID=A0A1I7U2K0_9PELO